MTDLQLKIRATVSSHSTLSNRAIAKIVGCNASSVAANRERRTEAICKSCGKLFESSFSGEYCKIECRPSYYKNMPDYGRSNKLKITAKQIAQQRYDDYMSKEK